MILRTKNENTELHSVEVQDFNTFADDPLDVVEGLVAQIHGDNSSSLNNSTEDLLILLESSTDEVVSESSAVDLDSTGSTITVTDEVTTTVEDSEESFKMDTLAVVKSPEVSTNEDHELKDNIDPSTKEPSVLQPEQQMPNIVGEECFRLDTLAVVEQPAASTQEDNVVKENVAPHVLQHEEEVPSMLDHVEPVLDMTVPVQILEEQRFNIGMFEENLNLFDRVIKNKNMSFQRNALPLVTRRRRAFSCDQDRYSDYDHEYRMRILLPFSPVDQEKRKLCFAQFMIPEFNQNEDHPVEWYVFIY